MAPWLSNDIMTQVSAATNPPVVKKYGGDTVVRLSERPEDHILMNSKALKKCSNWFQPRGDWELYGSSGPANTLTVFDPLTREHFPIYNYYMSGFLEGEHGLWLLHSYMSPYSSGLAPCMIISPEGWERSPKCKYAGSVSHTDLTTNFVGHYGNQNWSWIHGDWEFDDAPNGYKSAVKEYKTMFWLMFEDRFCLNGQQLGLPAEEGSRAITLIHAEHLANVAVRVNYHNCLHAIARQLVSILMNLPRIWQAIAEEPRWWIGFAVLVHADEIYTESFRYLVGSCCLTCHELPDCMDFNSNELSYEILKQRVQLAEINLRLRRELDLMSPKPYAAANYFEQVGNLCSLSNTDQCLSLRLKPNVQL